MSSITYSNEVFLYNKSNKRFPVIIYLNNLIALNHLFHSKPSPDTMNEYNKKVEFLKGLIETQKMVRRLFKLQSSQSKLLWLVELSYFNNFYPTLWKHKVISSICQLDCKTMIMKTVFTYMNLLMPNSDL